MKLEDSFDEGREPVVPPDTRAPGADDESPAPVSPPSGQGDIPPSTVAPPAGATAEAPAPVSPSTGPPASASGSGGPLAEFLSRLWAGIRTRVAELRRAR
jgi:hypothetical protein